MNKLLFFFCLLGVTAFAQTQPNISPADLNGMRAVGSPADPKVKEEWRKYHDYAQISDFCQRMVKAHPDLVKLQSIGKSFQGREMWLMTITDYKSGIPDRKPGFYIDGNIHGNEIQGGEIAMYTAWYLAENFYTMPFIRDLLRDRVFYIIPSINLDGRENFIHNPNTASSSRSGMMPLDDDDDGVIDEDKLDDLDGDGNIVTMRRKNPLGRWKVDPNYPTRMVPARTDEAGEYDLLGSEGLDNDGDGQVNEDNWGTYDPNRDWAWNWQPNYVQGGALFYPGTLPETRNIKSFVLAHPNIAGAQSYHNNGGMFLRGPGAAEDDPFYSQGDIAVYDVIGKIGEKIVPGYKYFIIHKDLYTVYGGEIDWFALTRGVFTFSNELMTSFKLFNQQPNAQQNRFQNQDYEEFDKYLLMGDGYVQWKPFKHPQFGDVEIGGPKKNYLRNHPGFLLEEDAHRNMSFTLLHAYQMPQLEVFSIKKKPLANNLTEITATVYNSRIMPTHSAHDLKYKIERPDHISLKNATVVVGMIVENEDFNQTKEQKYTPQTIDVPNIPGMGFVKVRWIVSGKADKVTVEVDSRKGGLISKTE